MARKYTKVTYNGDESEIKAILKAKNVDYIKIYYVRDDRIINISNNTVDVGNYNTPNMVTSSRYGDSVVAISPIKDALFIDDKIIGKQVSVELLDSGVIEIKLSEHLFADLKTVRFSFNDDVNSRDNFINELSFIEGLDDYLEGVETVFKTYPMYGVNTVMQKWYIVYVLNIFDKLDEYSHLISYFSPYGTNLSVDSMFDAFNIDEKYSRVLSNYFIPLCEKNHSGDVYGFTKEGTIHEIFEKIIMEECKESMLLAAENEHINLLTLRSMYYSDRTNLTHYINTYPHYFMDFIGTNNRTRTNNVFSEFVSSITKMQNLGIEPTMFNYMNLHLVEKAERYHIDINEYCDLISKINTKEGLLNYLKVTTA